jgi:hypothetical protein
MKHDDGVGRAVATARTRTTQAANMSRSMLGNVPLPEAVTDERPTPQRQEVVGESKITAAQAMGRHHVER